MTDEHGDIRRQAEDRVRLRFERQAKALAERQGQECARHTLLQSRAVVDSIASQATLELDKTLRLDSHDREWRHAKDRLANRPIPAPAFDMMGGPPPRNLAKDHDDLNRSWTAKRDQIVKDFDETIAGHKAARAEMQQGFARANEARDQGYREDRLALANRQRDPSSGWSRKRSSAPTGG